MEFRADRPHMPGYGIQPADQGGGLLPWSWAEERLVAALRYWVSTSSPENRPHLMPVWGVWVAHSLVFSTGAQSRKAKNLRVSPRCSVAIDGAEQAVIVEGTSSLLAEERSSSADGLSPARVASVYRAKYGMGPPEGSLVVRVVPEVVFGLIESSPDFGGRATRWRAVGGDVEPSGEG